jgi:hypothetical protein
MKLSDHQLCDNSNFRLDANVTLVGVFADSQFSKKRTVFAIGDTVYMPFKLNNKGLTVKGLFFESIEISTSTSSSMLFAGGSNLGAGNTVQLVTSPLVNTNQMYNSYAWLSFSLSRAAGSPFAYAYAAQQQYTVTVYFTLDYKHSKRVTGQRQRYSAQASFKIL